MTVNNNNMRWSMNRFIVPTQERRGLADDADDEGDTETDDDGTQRQALDYEGETRRLAGGSAAADENRTVVSYMRPGKLISNN